MPFTDADIKSHFEEKADKIIADNLEIPEEDPNAFDDLRDSIVAEALAYCKRMRKALSAVATASGSTTKSASGKSRSGKPYATFVKMMGAMKKGELEPKFLSMMVTPGVHFNTNKTSNSVARYKEFTEDESNPLDIDGEEITLEDLYAKIRDRKDMSNTVTLAGLMWGILPPDARTGLTSAYLDDHPPA